MIAIKSIRLWLWGAVIALALTVIAALVLLRPPVQAGFGQGSYNLIDQNGKPVDQTMFAGHPSALFFGFTHCPEVRPTTMAEMASWFAELGNDGRDLRAYFVSIDPQRDSHEVLGDYVSWVSDRITGITGTPE
ncbi:MAG: SCO family protein, partial [Candidatus Devosia euplotis]|nr:SCO family protein [Candidatus Devosia euplotis]